MGKFTSYSDPGSTLVLNNDHQINWIDLSVAREITRGQRLRDIKHEYYLRNKQCHDYPNMLLPSKSYNLKRRRKMETSRKEMKCDCTGPLNANWKNNRKSNEHKIGSRYKCSLRIAELAVPSKRHCIDTWRNKSYILPEHMVYRLRQHVLDQRPVVKLSEAIRCFQMKKTRSKKRCTKNMACIDVTKLQKPLRSMDTNSLCIMFVCRMMIELSNVMNLTLNDRMEKISRVVSRDVAKITKRGIKNGYSNKYASIHKETCNKITVWLNEILEDSFYKLLEDNLKDLEDEEGPVLDYLDDVIHNVLDICVPQSVPDKGDNNNITDADYIHYEINDIINNLITELDSDNEITDDCAPIKEHIQNYINNIIYDVIKDIHQEVDADQIIQNNDILPIKEHFHNEIHNLINDMVEDFQNEINTEQDAPDITSDSENLLNGTNETAVEEATDQGSQEPFENAQTDDLDYLIQGVGSDHDIILSTNFIQATTEDADDQSINVMFSNIDIGGIRMIQDLTNIFNFSELQEQHNTLFSLMENNKIINRHVDDEKIQEHRNTETDHIKRNIYFAEPNESFLSAVDELWPRDFSPDVLRPSTSVTKAIESLGDLFEREEIYMNPLNTDKDLLHSENSEHDSKILSNTGLVELPQNNQEWKSTEASLVNSNTSQKIFITNEDRLDDLNAALEIHTPLMEVTEETTKTSELYKTYTIEDPMTPSKNDAVENSEMQNREPHDQCAKKYHEPVTNIWKNEGDKEIPQNPNTTEEFKQFKTLDQSILENNNNNLTEKQQPQPLILQNSRNQPVTKEIIHDSKVQMEYAPSWVTHRNGHGEPSEICTPIPGITFTQKHKTVGCTCATTQVLPECVIKRWCKDLNKNFKTLDIWKLWLLNTCKETEILLKKNNTRIHNDKFCHNLMTLRNNLTKDTIIWRDVNQHVHEKFGPFKKYYGHNEMLYTKHSPRCVCMAIHPRKLKAKQQQ